MKSPNNGENRASAGQLSSPNNTSSFRNGLQGIQLLAKEVPWESPNNPTQTTVKANVYSPQTIGKTLLNLLHVEKLSWCLPRTFTSTD